MVRSAAAISKAPRPTRAPAPAPSSSGKKAAEAQENLRRFARSRVDMIRGYAETGGCRRESLPNCFGEAFAPPCGRYDVCEAGLVVPPAEEAVFPINSPVVHRTWGAGTVMRSGGGKVVVLFDTVGYRTLGVDVVREEGPLEFAG